VNFKSLSEREQFIAKKLTTEETENAENLRRRRAKGIRLKVENN